MRPPPVVIELPLLEARRELRVVIVLVNPEFLKIGQLRALDFSIQVRRERRRGPELDEVLDKPVLHGLGEERPTAIGLNSLDYEGHFLDDALKNPQRARHVSR